VLIDVPGVVGTLSVAPRPAISRSVTRYMVHDRRVQVELAVQHTTETSTPTTFGAGVIGIMKN
jgi:hypothetical protein